MSEPYVSNYFVSIIRDLDGSLYDLEDVNSKDLEISNPKTRVKKVGRGKGTAGFRHGSREASGSLEYNLAEQPDVPWEVIERDNETIQIRFKEGDSGRRFQAVDAVITSISKSGDEDGGMTMSINWEAKDYRQMR